jgi:hypothetical protein
VFTQKTRYLHNAVDMTTLDKPRLKEHIEILEDGDWVLATFEDHAPGEFPGAAFPAKLSSDKKTKDDGTVYYEVEYDDEKGKLYEVSASEISLYPICVDAGIEDFYIDTHVRVP